eukprot:429881-Rhodomonas_salina.2
MVFSSGCTWYGYSLRQYQLTCVNGVCAHAMSVPGAAQQTGQHSPCYGTGHGIADAYESTGHGITDV